MTYSESPDYLAILATVCDDPAADLPRLVLADWLGERGDKASAARAAFIRVQCEMAGKPRVSGDFVFCRSVHLTGTEAAWMASGRTGVNTATGPTPRCRCGTCRLLRRERDLLARHRIDWDAEVLAVPLASWHLRYRPRRYGGPTLDSDRWLFSGATLHYSRGFVTRLRLPPAAFIEYGAALLGAAPVERVTLSDPAFVGFLRVEIGPPNSGRGWRAGLHRRGEADAFDAAGWASRDEMAAGVAAAVAVALDLGHLVAG